MKNSQKGSTTTLIVIVIVLVAVAAVLIVWQGHAPVGAYQPATNTQTYGQPSASKAPVSKSNTPVKSQTTAANTTGWQTYTNSTYYYHVKYPTGADLIPITNGFTMTFALDKLKTTVSNAIISSRVYLSPCQMVRGATDVDKGTVQINGVTFSKGGYGSVTSSLTSLGNYYRVDRNSKCYTLDLGVQYSPAVNSPSDFHALSAAEKAAYESQTQTAVAGYLSTFDKMAQTITFI